VVNLILAICSNRLQAGTMMNGNTA
jgi:hypothetical protein